MKNKKIIIIISILSILLIISLVLLNVFKEKKVESIIIDVNYAESSNLKVSMTPSYSTVIYGTKNSIIKLNTKILTNNKQDNLLWNIDNDCATINENNIITINKETCEFNVYAKIDEINSNVLEFKITE